MSVHSTQSMGACSQVVDRESTSMAGLANPVVPQDTGSLKIVCLAASATALLRGVGWVAPFLVRLISSDFQNWVLDK